MPNNMKEWTYLDERLPPKGQVVLCLMPSGIVKELRMMDGGWCYPDTFDVLYIVPDAWKPVPK